MQNLTINAIHEDELEVYLDNLGLLEELKEKKLHCAFCEEIVTLDNFHCIFPDNDIKICCEKEPCRFKVKLLMQNEVQKS